MSVCLTAVGGSSEQRTAAWNSKSTGVNNDDSSLLLPNAKKGYADPTVLRYMAQILGSWLRVHVEAIVLCCPWLVGSFRWFGMPRCEPFVPSAPNSLSRETSAGYLLFFPELLVLYFVWPLKMYLISSTMFIHFHVMRFLVDLFWFSCLPLLTAICSWYSVACAVRVISNITQTELAEFYGGLLCHRLEYAFTSRSLYLLHGIWWPIIRRVRKVVKNDY